MWYLLSKTWPHWLVLFPPFWKIKNILIESKKCYIITIKVVITIKVQVAKLIYLVYSLMWSFGTLVETYFILLYLISTHTENGLSKAKCDNALCFTTLNWIEVLLEDSWWYLTFQWNIRSNSLFPAVFKVILAIHLIQNATDFNHISISIPTSLWC